jgi:uncharacterized cupredoxin-like copper-binding protein
MLKKIVSYGLISVMSLSILAACGTSDDDNAEPTVTRAASSNAPAIATATVEGESAAATAQAAGETAAEQPGEATEAGGESAAAPSGGPVELTVTAVDIAFEQKTLEGPADTEFTITVTNNGAAQHNFVIDELGITTKMLNPGESETVTINAPAGDYEYYCSVPGHKAAGMVGTLTLSAGGGAAAAPAGQEAATEEGTAAAAGGEQAASGPVDLAVTAVDIAFEQKTLEGPADTEFTITVTNNGAAQHDFAIDELGILTKMLNPGESETVTINAPAGDYTYYCSVPGHRPAGMEGTLTLSAGGGAAAAPAGEQASAPAATEATPAASPAASPAADQSAAGGATDIAIEAVDIAFSKTELTGPADTQFTITVTNNGAAQHDFVIDELGITTKMLNPGESETVTINAPAGEYEYYCSVPGHKPAGMVGKLILQ